MGLFSGHDYSGFMVLDWGCFAISFSSACLVPGLSLGCRGSFDVCCFLLWCFVAAVSFLVGLVGWLAL